MPTHPTPPQAPAPTQPQTDAAPPPRRPGTVRDVRSRDGDTAQPPDPAVIAMTNEVLISTKWVGRRSGNLFSVSRVEQDGPTPASRSVIYHKPGQVDGYRLAITAFSARFRPATIDEVWAEMQAAMATVPGTDGEVEVGFFAEPDHRHVLDRMVLYPETTEALRIGLNKINRRDELESVWGISRIEPRSNRCVINAYGPPGTGKTMAAMCVAATLERKIYQVDYSQIISKFIGDTAKHIRQAFKRAREENAIIFFDEADSLMSKRIGGGDTDRSFATSINQNRNVLMQELDRFDGVVIMSTNLFKNYDEAMIRRIAQHVPFRLPNKAMRLALFKLHLPVIDRVTVDDAGWDQIATMTKGFSGGDILNVIINAINRGSLSVNTADWKMRTEDLLVEAARVAEAKAHHGGSKAEKRMGPKAVQSAIGTDAQAGAVKTAALDDGPKLPPALPSIPGSEDVTD